MNKEQEKEFISESSLLVMMIDAAIMQATAIKGTPIVQQQIKQVFNPFFAYGRKLSKKLSIVLERDGAAEAYEVVAPFVYEAMREITKSKNKVEALALLKSYNEGKVQIK